jgi:hypothetical protein
MWQFEDPTALPAMQHSKAVGWVASMQWVAGKRFVQLSQMALTAQEVEIQHTLRVTAEPGTVDLSDHRAFREDDEQNWYLGSPVQASPSSYRI